MEIDAAETPVHSSALSVPGEGTMLNLAKTANYGWFVGNPELASRSRRFRHWLIE